MFSHGMGCNMAHQTVSSWVPLPWNQPAIVDHFCLKKTHLMIYGLKLLQAMIPHGSGMFRLKRLPK